MIVAIDKKSISTGNSSNFWVAQPQKLFIKTKNQSEWANLTIPEPKEMSSSGPIGKSENNPEQDCRNYYTSN